MNRKQIMLELADERSTIQITELKMEIDKLKAENEKLTKNYFTVILQRNVAEQQLDQLKAENKHLSEKEEEARHYLEEAEKFKNCLAEIKEIAERGFKHSQCNCGAKADLDLILQKISEVLK